MASNYPNDHKSGYDTDERPELPSKTGTASQSYPNEKAAYSSHYTSDDYDPTDAEVHRSGLHRTKDSSYPSESTYYPERTQPTKRLSYSDDDQHISEQPVADTVETPLVRNASKKNQYVRFEGMDYADPEGQTRGPPQTEKKGLAKYFASARYPLEQRIQDKKRGIGRQKHPFVVYALTAAMVAVFVYELVYNSREQGSPFSFKPVVNPMLGPSSSALVSLGARFPPCMKLVVQVPPSTPIGCANNTANPVTEVCTVQDLCAFGGFPNGEPNQWFRFITPIFLHAGIIHILINMLAQLTLSAQIEREMGSGGFILTYFAAGIFGNVLGGNFSLVGVPSVGASGAIFGTVAVTWVDLFAHWKYQYRPVRKLIFMTIELLIGIAIGYIPYVDNFAHIGGFVMGLFVGTFFYPVISETKRHRGIMWGFRLAALPFAIILYVILTRNFYTSDPYSACSGCRYLSCFPSAANNRCQGTGLTTSNTGI